MKIGYPCINRRIGCQADKKFRLSSYSEVKLKETIIYNLDCLSRILEFNVENNVLFFRISSDTIPFASHPICTFDWLSNFGDEFLRIGELLKRNKIRISMHPGQFIVLNSPKKEIVSKSIKELEYHSKLLDALKLDKTAKIQIHVGGVYGDKEAAINRFFDNYKELNQNIRKRLVIENDERSYNLEDCLQIHQELGIPIILDTLHHEFNNNGEKINEAITIAEKSWSFDDGIQMVDFSNINIKGERSKHGEELDVNLFEQFIRSTIDKDFDIMLELKDKERSALKAIEIMRRLRDS